MKLYNCTALADLDVFYMVVYFLKKDSYEILSELYYIYEGFVLRGILLPSNMSSL